MSATFEQDCAALWIKEQMSRFGADFMGAIEWMETAKAQEMYIEHNGAKNIRSSAKSAIEALEMAIKAYKEAVNHAEAFGCAGDWESIRIRLMVHYANLKSGFMGSIETAEAAKPVTAKRGSHQRFADLAAMVAFAVQVATQSTEKVWCESGIYTDDNGLSFRPEIALRDCDGYVYILRWNAFTDQDNVSHMGIRARRDARTSSDWFVDQIQSAINSANTATVKTRVRATAHLDGGHDMETVALTFVAMDSDSARVAMETAMTQLGFKRSDYGHIHLTVYA